MVPPDFCQLILCWTFGSLPQILEVVTFLDQDCPIVREVVCAFLTSANPQNKETGIGKFETGGLTGHGQYHNRNATIDCWFLSRRFHIAPSAKTPTHLRFALGRLRRIA